MTYIIAFLFITVNGDQYLNSIEEPYFTSKRHCELYVKMNYPNTDRLKYYCVPEKEFKTFDYK